MKKFALKQSLESTHFEDLQQVAAEAGNHARKVAEAFCKLQDAERKLNRNSQAKGESQ